MLIATMLAGIVILLFLLAWGACGVSDMERRKHEPEVEQWSTTNAE